jgi:NAD(P)-dependent dehydrogenase (short-subunit alcohol dehydrogenase family)
LIDGAALKGRHIVITGAASGIGAALARALAREGAALLLADIDAPRLAALAAELSNEGRAAQVLALGCDVGRREDIDALAAAARQAWGGADILINNAGVALVAPVATLSPADARWLFEINFWGVVGGCQAFIPLLRGRPGATIVNVSSIFAMVSMPTQSVYNAAKAGVRAFSDALREELRAEAIRVLAVHPGGIRTRIAEQARLADISMVAASPDELQAQFLANAPTSAEQAAAAIVGALRRGDTRLLIGADARLMDLVFRLAPARASAWFTRLVRWKRQRRAARA